MSAWRDLRPQALQSTEPSSSLLQRGVVEVLQFAHVGACDIDVGSAMRPGGLAFIVKERGQDRVSRYVRKVL